MVFSDEDKAVIKHYHQGGCTAYKIWKENPEKNWDKTYAFDKQIFERNNGEKRRVRSEKDC